MKRKLILHSKQMITLRHLCRLSLSKQSLRKIPSQSGFTLMELLVVMFVIAALSIPALLMHNRIRDWMHKQEFYSVAKNFEKLAQAHYTKQVALRKASYATETGDEATSNWNGSFIPNPDRNQDNFRLGSTVVSEPIQAVDRDGIPRGNFFMIGGFLGTFQRLSGDSVCAPMYPEAQRDNCRSWFSEFDGVKDTAALTVDGWKQPTLVVMYVPNPPATGDDYCPIRDSSSPKILYISSGRNTEFSSPRGQVGLALNDFIGQQGPFLEDGSWNPAWSPNQWTPVRGRTKNENLYYKISFDALDQKYYDESIKTLRAVETNLKNSFYSKISGHMEIPTPDPWPNLTGDCFNGVGAARGLFLQPTRANWFVIGADRSVMDGGIANHQSLANVTGMSRSDLTDAWGNRILWDPSVKGTNLQICDVLLPPAADPRNGARNPITGALVDGQALAQIPSLQVAYNREGNNFVFPPYAARVFSSCGYTAASGLYPVYGSGPSGDDGNAIWPSNQEPVLFDNNLTITVPGMY